MYIIAAVLVVIWAAVFFLGYLTTWYVHVLLAAAVVLVLVQLFGKNENGQAAPMSTPGGQPPMR